MGEKMRRIKNNTFKKLEQIEEQLSRIKEILCDKKLVELDDKIYRVLCENQKKGRVKFPDRFLMSAETEHIMSSIVEIFIEKKLTANRAGEILNLTNEVIPYISLISEEKEEV